MALSENETRARYIDEQLADAGWHVGAVDLELEYEVASVGEVAHGFSDYLLSGIDGKPLAVVEAKRTSRDAIAGKEQAQRYAEAIAAADGRRPLVFLANGNEIWFWDLADNPRLVSGFFPQADLERRRFQRDEALPLSETEINTSIAERPYQHEAIRRIQEALTERRRKALWVMATGTGKTRAAAALIDTLLRARWAQRVLFLVDRRELARQAHETFQEHLPHEPSAIVRAADFDPTKRLYVATLQTMQDFHSEFAPSAFDLVIADECHRSIYDRWEPIVNYFDSRLVGLTATPSDYISRNTFAFFGCPNGVPTFAYELDQAVDEGYLVPYEAYHARTTIQVAGIRGNELAPEIQDQLREEGIDPDDIDFAGTDLERRVTNVETTRLLVNEFFEQALTDPGGSLPGKSIIFAMSHAHAKRIWEMFNAEYPQFPGLAEIIDSHMENPEGLLRRFKLDDFPRIAISVDMLETGVDVPTVLNLGLLRPVFSRIKFWQMIGRGTRLVDEFAEKPWCPAGSKSKFRVLDFWENFERFQINPEGVAPAQTTPVAARLFRLLLQAARAAVDEQPDLAAELRREAQEMVGQLPSESAGVREHRALLESVRRDEYWKDLTQQKRQLLTLEVAPLMRFLPGVDLQAATFRAAVLEFVIAHLSADRVAANDRASELRDSVTRLPVAHADVAPHEDVIRAVGNESWPENATLEDVLALRDLEPLMKLRLREPTHVITLDLADAFQERRWLAVGPEAKEFDVADYRSKVEQHVRELAAQHPAMLKLTTAQPMSEGDVAAIESALNQPDLYITEETLKEVYDAPHGSLLSLLRHALGIEELQPREDAIKAAFEAFIVEKAYLNPEQILFVRLFAARLVQAGRVEEADLYEQPFTLLAADSRRELPEDDFAQLFELAATYER